MTIAVPSGILPIQAIRRLVDAGAVAASVPVEAGQLQPASLDLRLGPVAYRVRASFLPGAGKSVKEKLDAFTLHAIDLTGGAVLETGCVYVVPLLERLALPREVAASTNPKSSTGRLDVFTRVIADGVSAFDVFPAGTQAALYVEICPQTFPVLVRTGSRLTQIRFRVGNPVEDDAGLRSLHLAQSLTDDRGDPVLDDKGEPISVEVDIANGIAVSVDLLGGADGLIGYRAKKHAGLVDVDRQAACPVLDYWEPIAARGPPRLILDPDQFYILASKEAVHVPPTHAAEMMPFNPLVGEFRVHYAGFMDPGFGHGPVGSGARVVLEVRSHSVPFILEDGQIIGRLVYERMLAPPDVLYGQGLGSNYQGQGLKLSKHFQ